ncbi:MAG: hypothetical protein ACOYT4_04765 [Nanoarchaeota archaeon]
MKNKIRNSLLIFLSGLIIVGAKEGRTSNTKTFNKIPICTFVKDGGKSFLVANDECNAWEFGYNNSLKKSDCIPQIPLYNQKALEVAEIIDKHGQKINSPLWASLKIENPGYSKRLSFGDYIYTFYNINEEKILALDSLRIETISSKLKLCDVGLDGLDTVQANNHIFLDNDTKRYSPEFEMALNLLAKEYSNN